LKAVEIFQTNRNRTLIAMRHTRIKAAIADQNVAETAEVVVGAVRAAVVDEAAEVVAGTEAAVDEAAEVAVAEVATKSETFLNQTFVCLKVKSQEWPRIFSRPFFPGVV